MDIAFRFVLIIILSYILGNFSTAYLIAKLYAGIDIRNYGSGNAGATNALRTLGKKAGIAALFGDILKGALAVILGKYVAGENGQILAGLFVVIGHNWPAFLNFRGGKGVATTIGVMAAINPVIVAGIVPTGIVLIAITKYVSLASILGMTVFPIIMLLTKQSVKLVLFSFILSAMAVYRHKSNIKKLLAGTENKLGQKSDRR
ncbi:MAG: glycerol-3-phosphate 1-O-acyltransferase PlsY [Clostridiales bacterium]|nr:glycerol-3-phosphate 1-O-acyltransferase PlsY [Clostridiales bacterium]